MFCSGGGKIVSRISSKFKREKIIIAMKHKKKFYCVQVKQKKDYCQLKQTNVKIDTKSNSHIKSRSNKGQAN